MARFESGMPGARRADRATSWQRIASRTPVEIIAYDRLNSLRAEADSERLARLAHRRPEARRRVLRFQLGIALARLARAVGGDSMVATRPAATATTKTTPCPE